MRDWDLRPDEIHRRRFSLKLSGVDRREVEHVLHSLAAALDRSRDELARCFLDQAALQKSLRKSHAAIEVLKRQLAAVEETLKAYQQSPPPILAPPEHVTITPEQVVDDPSAMAPQTVAETREADRALTDQVMRAADRLVAARFRRVQLEEEWLVEQTHLALFQIAKSSEQYVSALLDTVEGLVSPHR